MNSRERVFALLDGQPVDHLPAMPITMMFAADQVDAKYYDYATNFKIQADGQIRVAEKFGADQVSVISLCPRLSSYWLGSSDAYSIPTQSASLLPFSSATGLSCWYVSCSSSNRSGSSMQN